jgi:hypothetical protein
MGDEQSFGRNSASIFRNIVTSMPYPQNLNMYFHCRGEIAMIIPSIFVTLIDAVYYKWSHYMRVCCDIHKLIDMRFKVLHSTVRFLCI